MFNIISVLLSLALMLTGAAAPGQTEPVQLDAPVARTLTLSNINLMVNDQQVALTPSAAIGVMTDGTQAVYDFAVTAGDARLLPFQLLVDETGLLLANENSGAALKLTAEELEETTGALTSTFSGMASQEDMDEESQAVMKFLTEEYLPAYRGLFELIQDKEQMKALQAQSETLMDEIVDRGEGVPGEAEVDGENIPVITYTYTLDGPTLGRLADRMLQLNEALSNYYDAYFKLLNMVAKDEPTLQGLDSMEKLMGLTDMKMDMVESVGEDGTDITDAVITITFPEEAGDMPPMVMNVQGYRHGDDSQATVDFTYEYQGAKTGLTMEASQFEDDTRVSYTFGISLPEETEADTTAETEADITAEIEDEELEVAVNDLIAALQELNEENAAAEETPAEEAEPAEETVPAEEAEPAEETATAEEAETAEEAVSVEQAEEAEVVEESDAPVDIYDFYLISNLYDQPGGAEGERAYGVTVYATYQEAARVNFEVNGLSRPDGTCENGVVASLKYGDDYYDFSCDLDVTAEPIAIYADPEKAVSTAEFDPTALTSSVTADLLNLSLDDSVQQLIGLFVAEEAPEVEYDDESGETLDLAGRNAEPYDDGVVAFGVPQFGWVPEGYRIETQDVDTQYDMVSYTFVNPESGNDFTVDFYAGSDDDGAVRYNLDEDGTATRLDGLLVTEEHFSDTARAYSVEDGVSVMIFSVNSDDVDADAIFHMISSVTY